MNLVPTTPVGRRDHRIAASHRDRICEPLAAYLEALCWRFVVQHPTQGTRNPKETFEAFRPLYFGALDTNALDPSGFVLMLWSCAWSEVLSPAARLREDGTVSLSAGGRALDEPRHLVEFITAGTGLTHALAVACDTNLDRSVAAVRQVAFAMPDLERGLAVGQMALEGFRNLKRVPR